MIPLIGLVYRFKNMNIIDFPIFPTSHPSTLKSFGYGGNLITRRYEKLEFVDEIFNSYNNKTKEKTHQRSKVCKLENA